MIPFLLTYVTFYNQSLSHFYREIDSDHFEQKVFIDEKFSSLKYTKSIICYIYGEDGLPDSNVFPDIVVEIASETNSTLVAIEHRYFGNSKPSRFADLIYLTSQQMLVDMARILGEYKSYNNATIFLVGSNYGGSLAAWFRLKYPHIADGSWSSSSPLRALNQFYQFDVMTSKRIISKDKKCFNNIRTVLNESHNIIYNGSYEQIFELQQKFGFTYDVSTNVMDNTIGEAPSIIIRANMLKEFCNNFSVPTIENYAVAFTKALESLGMNIKDFDYKNVQGSGYYRYFMQCDAFGWFHVFPKDEQYQKYALRTRNINTNFYTSICHQIFGTGTNNFDEFNMMIDTLSHTSYNMLFTYDYFDPYKEIGAKGQNEGIVVIKANDTYEKWDLSSEKPSDSEDVKLKRILVKEIAIDIMNGGCQRCVNGVCTLGRCICNKGYRGKHCDEAAIEHDNLKIISAAAALIPTIILIVAGVLGWVLFVMNDNSSNYFVSFY